MCVCMFEQGGMFVWRGTALTLPSLPLQRWNVAVVCLIGVFSRRWGGPRSRAPRHRWAVSHLQTCQRSWMHSDPRGRAESRQIKSHDFSAFVAFLLLPDGRARWLTATLQTCCQLLSDLMCSSIFHALWGWRVTCSYRRRLMWSAVRVDMCAAYQEWPRWRKLSAWNLKKDKCVLSRGANWLCRRG